MQFKLIETRIGIRNSTTRIPFRYGKACMTRCPQVIVGAMLEVGGRRQEGYSGDGLPPGWFDKMPGKDFRQQLTEMFASIDLGRTNFADAARHETTFFPAWRAAYDACHSAGRERRWTPLLTTLGVSMVERAVIDALCRAAGISFFQAVRGGLLDIDPGAVHPQLADHQPADWLPTEPTRTIFVRHTVGLGDPLTSADIPPDQRLEDGLPQAFEEYVARTGTRYFKIKVCNQREFDLQRLAAIARIVEDVRGDDYFVTLDGNEQYGSADEFAGLIDGIEADAKLRRLWDRTICIEQPLERSVALDAAHTEGIRTLGQRKPVIVDESDGELGTYPAAIELGYRGVSSKACKGPVKSLCNAGLTWRMNDRGRTSQFLMTGEDLCTVGIVPVQQDLCLVAAMGLRHVERNGHHFHRGLSYLPRDQQAAALQSHSDLYEQRPGFVAPHVDDGRFQIGSVQCPGFGFAVIPDWSTMLAPEEWSYESLEEA